MNRPDLADLAFAVLVIMIGVAPVLAVPGWSGYGPHGEFSCNCGQYFVRFSDPNYGGDRPNIFTTYQGFQVDVVQMSDTASTVDGLNLYSDFTTTPSLSGGTLSVAYSSPVLNLTKQVSVKDGAVDVNYDFGRNVTAVLTVWRWYFGSVGPYNIPTTREISGGGDIGFSFFSQGAIFNGSLVSTPGPVSAQISGVEGAGLNKITLTYQGSSIDLSVRLTGVKAVAGAGVLDVGSSNEAFPVIGVALAAAYLGAREWVKVKK